MTNEFALDLKLARKKAGFTQRDCAHLLAVHPATLSDLENGKRPPRLAQLCELSLIYGRSFQSLFNEIIETAKHELSDRLQSLPDAPKDWISSVNREYSLDRLAERLDASDTAYETP